MPERIPRTLLVILDGWGEREEREGNAIASARTPHWDRLLATCPRSSLVASGEDVGLPPGLMGNSEVGHLNIGAGRIVDQDIQRITRAIREGRLDTNPALGPLYDDLRARGAALHLMGLVSDGGVHSLDLHLVGLIEMAARRGLGDVRIHAFLDGRDTPPSSALGYLRKLEAELRRIGVGRVVSVAGRYYAMDRDQRWERTERAWRTIVLGEGDPGLPAAPSAAPSVEAAVKESYAHKLTDEFVLPIPIAGERGARSCLDDGAGVVFFNFRADRARQLTRAIADPAFAGFARPRMPRVAMVTMTRYDAAFPLPAAFPKEVHLGILADALAGVGAGAGAGNLRVAETEKYAHVTYFFNGGVEPPWPGESRVLIPSQKVATYDLAPAMSAFAITQAITSAMRAGEPPVVIANYANADMVGHTGRFEATVRAVEVIDECLGVLVAEADRTGHTLFVTADHGNAELMVDPETGEPHTAHTTNPVPFLIRPGDGRGRLALAASGRLADVVPTILGYWGLAPTPEMTGEDLLRR